MNQVVDTRQLNAEVSHHVERLRAFLTKQGINYDETLSDYGTVWLEWTSESQVLYLLEIGSNTYGISIIGTDNNYGESGPLDGDYLHLQRILTGELLPENAPESREY